jgi:hypothetical protein
MKKLLLLGLMIVPTVDIYAGKKKKGSKTTTTQTVPSFKEQALELHATLFPKDNLTVEQLFTIFDQEEKQVPVLVTLLEDAHLIEQTYRSKHPEIKTLSLEDILTVSQNIIYGAQGHNDLEDKETLSAYLQWKHQEHSSLQERYQKRLDKQEHDHQHTTAIASAKALVLQQRKDAKKIEQAKKREQIQQQEQAKNKAERIRKAKELQELEQTVTAQDEYAAPSITSPIIVQSMARITQVFSCTLEVVRHYNKTEYYQDPHELITTVKISQNQIIDVKVTLAGETRSSTIKMRNQAYKSFLEDLSTLTAGCPLQKITNISHQLRQKYKSDNSRKVLKELYSIITNAFSQDLTCTTADKTTLIIIKDLVEEHMKGPEHLFRYDLLYDTLAPIGSRPDIEVVLTPCNPPKPKESNTKKLKHKTTVEKAIATLTDILHRKHPDTPIQVLTREELPDVTQEINPKTPIAIELENILKGSGERKQELLEQFTTYIEETPSDTTLHYIQKSFDMLHRALECEEPISVEVVFCPYHACTNGELCLITPAPPMPDHKIKHAQEFINQLIEWFKIPKTQQDTFPETTIQDPEIVPLIDSISKILKFYIFESQIKKESIDTEVIITILETYRDTILPYGWRCDSINTLFQPKL